MSSSRPSNEPPRRLLIFGAGGASREAAWLARTIWGADLMICFVVTDPTYLRPPVNGIEVALLSATPVEAEDRFVAPVGDMALRRSAVRLMEAQGATPATLIHPRAEVAPNATIGEGSLVCAGTVISTDVRVGRHVVINIGASLSHDVAIGDFSTVSPGVRLAGHVRVGADVLLGVGATVANGRPDDPLRIGAGAVVAAGACVLATVEPGSLVAGVPAIRKR